VAISTRLKQLVSRSHERPFDPGDYWERRHRVFHDSHKAVGHIGISDEANAQQYEVKLRLILDAIKRHAEPAKRRTLLDAGCGIGLLTRGFCEAGFAVVGADFSTTAIERARSDGPDAEFFVSPLATLRFGRQFDVVVAIDVLLHVVDDEAWVQTVSALTRHLAEGGVLVVIDWFDDTARDLGKHVRPRSLARYVETLDALGCSVLQHKKFHLDHEKSTKDLLIARHDACPLE